MATTKSAKVAFITGGNRGIGFETARELGEQGIEVVLGVRDLDKGLEAVKKLQARGIRAAAIRFDAEDAATFQLAHDYFAEKHGKLDILVNNAGVMKEKLEDGANSSKVSTRTLRDTFETNFFAVVALTQVLLPLVRKAPEGRIVNLSSILGSLTLHSQPDSPIAFAKAFAYNASKTALNAFTVHLANELKDTPVKVNSAHPGWVKTDMGGEAAPLEVAEGGKTSAQLALLDSKGSNGAFVHVGQALPW
ncbi:short-chain dehydrogenase [Betaproteobacteria bacterium GR16-43]|nr:short-chain dehydrogenase [Betaproteobacteria bacterium GR16-43]